MSVGYFLICEETKKCINVGGYRYIYINKLKALREFLNDHKGMNIKYVDEYYQNSSFIDNNYNEEYEYLDDEEPKTKQEQEAADIDAIVARNTKI